MDVVGINGHSDTLTFHDRVDIVDHPLVALIVLNEDLVMHAFEYDGGDGTVDIIRSFFLHIDIFRTDDDVNRIVLPLGELREKRVYTGECLSEDIVEIDTFNELKAIDKIYDV